MALLSTVSFVPLLMTQAQPLPNRPIAAFFSSSFSLSKLPKDEVMASATAPVGAPPARRALHTPWSLNASGRTADQSALPGFFERLGDRRTHRQQALPAHIGLRALLDRFHAGQYVAMRQHHALGLAGGAGGK